MVADDEPIGEMIGRLFDDAQAYARAEADLVKAKVERKIGAYRMVAVLAAIAATIAFGAFLALVVTLVLWASSLIGPLGGGLAVTLIVAGLAALVAWLAKRQYEAIDE